MKTLRELKLEKENLVLKKKISELEYSLKNKNEISDMWYEKSEKLDEKLKALKAIINVI